MKQRYKQSIQNHNKYPKRKKGSNGLWAVHNHRLFNPDLPLSAETGAELNFGYYVIPNLKLNGSVRKSILTNLADNKRRSDSVLPRVHSDWPLYDIAGQNGYINNLSLEYSRKLTSQFFGRLHAGF